MSDNPEAGLSVRDRIARLSQVIDNEALNKDSSGGASVTRPKSGRKIFLNPSFSKQLEQDVVKHQPSDEAVFQSQFRNSAFGRKSHIFKSHDDKESVDVTKSADEAKLSSTQSQKSASTDTRDLSKGNVAKSGSSQKSISTDTTGLPKDTSTQTSPTEEFPVMPLPKSEPMNDLPKKAHLFQQHRKNFQQNNASRESPQNSLLTSRNFKSNPNLFEETNEPRKDRKSWLFENTTTPDDSETRSFLSDSSQFQQTGNKLLQQKDKDAQRYAQKRPGTLENNSDDSPKAVSRFQQLRNKLEQKQNSRGYQQGNLASSKNFKSNPNISQQEDSDPTSISHRSRNSNFNETGNQSQLSKESVGGPCNVKKGIPRREIVKKQPNKQKQLIDDFDMFKDVDAHAKNTPQHAERSLTELVRYLKSGTHNQLEVTRAFYMWIAYNISYDFGLTQVTMTPEQIMHRRAGVCQAYSDLFQEMCRIAGLEVVQITGFAKGFGCLAGHSFQASDVKSHAWNAVYICGEWRFVDCTWGTGHVDEKKIFKRKLNNHYFMTDPEEMIWSHFPIDDNDPSYNKWQLLPTPLTLEEFNALPRIHSYFFQFGLSLSTGTEHPIMFDETLDWIVQSPQPVQYIYKFTKRGQEKDNYLNKFIFYYIENASNSAIFEITPPSSGEFQLHLYAKQDSDTKTTLYHEAITVTIICRRPTRNPPHYPTSPRWGPNEDFYKLGLKMIDYDQPIFRSGDQLIIQSEEKLSTVINILNIRDEVIKDSTFFSESFSGNRLTVKISPTRKGYFKMMLFGKPDTKDGGKQLLPHIGDFLIDNKFD